VKPIPEKLVEELYRAAHADRWPVAIEIFALALRISVDRAAPADVARYLRGLHLEDLALACACAVGNDDAWDHFIGQHRPVLYRAADSLDASGGAREIADSIYAELYGLPRASERARESREIRAGEGQSLFNYYHGRSSLNTWLRAVLAQRHVDRIRAAQRFDPLPEEDGPDALPASTATTPDPDRLRYRALMHRAFRVALGKLADRDRLRLACYYTQELTLAETGRILKEHEATVSRQLAKTRKLLRQEVERHLRDQDRLGGAQIEQCFSYVLEDPGPMDLGGMLRKNSASDRSI
jgi:RNA polymerase sigma factor (sigma-70 family)